MENMMKKSCTSFTLFVALIFFVGIPFAVVTADEKLDWEDITQAEIVWSEYDGEHNEIFYATYDEGEWSEGVQITHDQYQNLHPVIVRSADGYRFVAWTAFSSDKESVINWSEYVDGSWSDAQTVEFEMTSNIKPSIAMDEEGVIWMTWSANRGDLDEIFYSRFIAGQWESPKLVNQKNDVPDVLPEIYQDTNATMSIQWTGFKPGEGYVRFQTAWNGEKWTRATVVTADQDDNAPDLGGVEQLEMPEFVPIKEMSTLLIIKE